MTRPCPAQCGRTCGIHSLCDPCWNRLPPPASMALSMIHAGSGADHQQLFDQLNAGIPVSEIQIHSRNPQPQPKTQAQLSLFDTTV